MRSENFNTSTAHKTHSNSSMMPIEQGALIEIKGHVAEQATALGIFAPAKVEVAESGEAKNVRVYAIGETNDNLLASDKMVLIEAVLAKISGESDLIITEMQQNLRLLRETLRRPTLTYEQELNYYQDLSKAMQELKDYYLKKQEKAYDNNGKQGTAEKNVVFSLGGEANLTKNYITHEKSIQEKLEKHLVPLFIKTESKTSDKDFRSLAQQIYVEPESSWAGETRNSLKKRCDAFIKQPEQKVFVILGDPGVGKTTFGLRYIQSCWEHFQKNNKTNAKEIICDEPLSLFIRLNEILKDGKIISDLLENFLKKKVGLT
ncbi:MAG: hypothetical protein ACK4PR_11065, partial [Gammaproteobacteria bacterium]